ncbi:MAG: AAA family ATPase [Acidimicrobiales bacterium]
MACARCGQERTFLRWPLLCLTGPSGAGKSTVAALVADGLAERLVTLEQDVLWSPELADRPGGTRQFRATWLALAAMIGQAGRPVLLCGTVVPAELEPLAERTLFARIHYLALDAPAELLAARLRARPAWRGWGEARVAEMLAFAAELRRDAAAMTPPVELLDTSGLAAAATAARVAAWAEARLRDAPPA